MVVGKFFVLICLDFENILEFSKDFELKYKIDSSPSNIRQIADYISNESDQANKPVILWYGPYMNPRILNYYLLINGRKNKEVRSNQS